MDVNVAYIYERRIMKLSINQNTEHDSVLCILPCSHEFDVGVMRNVWGLVGLTALVYSNRPNNNYHGRFCIMGSRFYSEGD